MANKTYKNLQYTQHKEYSRMLVRICDFVDLFTTVNNKIIKLEAKKKERGIKINEVTCY
jgi:hypothetical protein